MKSNGAGNKASRSWGPQRSPRHLSVAEPHLCDMIEIVVVSAWSIIRRRTARRILGARGTCRKRSNSAAWRQRWLNNFNVPFAGVPQQCPGQTGLVMSARTGSVGREVGLRRPAWCGMTTTWADNVI